MSPELLDPDHLEFEDGRPTRDSDCYALGMVILEVLSGRVPFAGYHNLIVMQKIIRGEHPERPEGVWLTDDLWEVLERCWSPQPRNRHAVESVLECLGLASAAWELLLPSAHKDILIDEDCKSRFIPRYLRVFLPVLGHSDAFVVPRMIPLDSDRSLASPQGYFPDRPGQVVVHNEGWQGKQIPALSCLLLVSVPWRQAKYWSEDTPQNANLVPTVTPDTVYFSSHIDTSNGRETNAEAPVDSFGQVSSYSIACRFPERSVLCGYLTPAG